MNNDKSLKSLLDMQKNERIEQACKIAEEYYSKSSNPKFHRTKEESSAATQFSMENSKLIKKYEDEMYNSIIYDTKYPLSERIEACNQSIQVYNHFKSFCYSSFGGKIYFQNMWEYCHNAHNECFSYKDMLKEKLTKLQNKLTKEQDVNDLENDLYELLTIENPILQSKLFSYYSPKYKYAIKKILSEWESYNAIKKTKYKNSYMIELVD